MDSDIIRINKFHFVNKDNFDYFTELDVLDRVSKEKNIDIKELEDMFTLLMEYIKNVLKDRDDEKGYLIKGFGYFYKRQLKASDLLLTKGSIKYKKAMKQLDYYMNYDSKIIKIS